MNTQVLKVVLFTLAVVVLFGGGYAAGRYASPDKVVVSEKLVTVEKQVVVTTVDTDRILNALKDVKVQKDVHTVRVVEREPDGTTKTTITQDDKTKTESETKVQDKEHLVETKTEEKLVYKDREVTKTIERSRPNWSLALQPGFDFAAMLGRSSSSYSFLPTLPVQHLMLGVSIERRLVGPLFTGVWANSAGAGGLTLRLEF